MKLFCISSGLGLLIVKKRPQRNPLRPSVAVTIYIVFLTVEVLSPAAMMLLSNVAVREVNTELV